MAFSVTALAGAGDDGNANSYATASISPTANRLVLAFVVNSKGSTPDEPTLSGNGLTWVKVATVTFNTIASPTKRTTLFRAMGASPSAGAVTIDFGGVNQTGCTWSIFEVADVDTGGTNGSAAVVQSATAQANSAGSLAIDLAAFGSADNGTVAGFGVAGTKTVTPGTGLTEIHDVGGASPAREIETCWRSDNDLQPDASLTAGGTDDWGGIAIEIKLAAAGGISGSLSKTLGSLTAAATGALLVQGSASKTLGALTLSATGTVTLAGALDKALGALTLSAAGAVAITGALSKTLGTLVLSAAGVGPGGAPALARYIPPFRRRRR